MCPILKKLSTQLQPFHEVIGIKDEILASKKENDVRVLVHLLSYLVHQFGEKVAGIDYRERVDGERVSNWEVEIEILQETHCRLADLYDRNNSLSMIRRNEMSFPYLERSLGLLNPWLIQLDQDASNRIDSRINRILHELYYIEQTMAINTMNTNQYDTAEGNCQRSLAYSKRYGLEGEKKISMIFGSLRIYCELRQRQGNLLDAVIFAEEAYNLVVEAYDCVHPQVQEAAGVLINILVRKGDLFDAERYAQVTYGILRDKKNGIDQESEIVAMGAYNLAHVIYWQNGDLIKAEALARESLRIRTLICGSNQTCGGLLAGILGAQGKFGDEMKGLYERSLAISLRHEGSDGVNVAFTNFNMGKFYGQLANIQPTVDAKRTQLLLAKSHFVEALRIQSKVYGPTHPSTVKTASHLNIISEASSQI
jgi:hypothetical protein